VERRRLAADIHDGITQRLCACSSPRRGDESLSEDPIRRRKQLAKAHEHTHLTIAEARAAINCAPAGARDLGCDAWRASPGRAGVSGGRGGPVPAARDVKSAYRIARKR